MHDAYLTSKVDSLLCKDFSGEGIWEGGILGNGECGRADRVQNFHIKVDEHLERGS